MLDVLIVDDDYCGEHLKKTLKKKEDIRRADYAKTAEEALNFLELIKYDVVLLDLIMAPCDGFGFLERMHRMALRPGPDVIIVSAVNNEDVIRKSFAMGAKYYMIKPFQEEIVYRRIWDVVRLGRQEVQEGTAYTRNRTDVGQRITDLFLMIGVPPHLKGYQYLKEAVKLAAEDRMIIYSITKRLYPEIAKRFDVSGTKVELAIRHTIEVMWERGTLKEFGKMLGFRKGEENQKPTNGEFIALITDKLISLGGI
ncbi:MAG: sporulation transcription factor Spo0A [Christensenella sp.]|nr:sporulation transcription factor Spo0A [Christensenella sp.]